MRTSNSLDPSFELINSNGELAFNLEGDRENEYFGVSSGILGLSCYIGNFCSDEKYMVPLGIAWNLRGLSAYVMRADSPPYQKSQLKKKVKNLAGKIKDVLPSPQPLPSPVPVRYSSNLEDYLKE